MRQIKFRAWHEEGQEMVNFNNYKLRTDEYQRAHLAALMDGQYGDVLMQYTGLKDVDGKYIFEGDIVAWLGAICYIKWEDSDASFMAVEKYESWAESGQEWANSCLVIGNIHQNPELLK